MLVEEYKSCIIYFTKGVQVQVHKYSYQTLLKVQKIIQWRLQVVGGAKTKLKGPQCAESCDAFIVKVVTNPG